jgi:hypothetical protein
MYRRLLPLLLLVPACGDNLAAPSPDAARVAPDAHAAPPDGTPSPDAANAVYGNIANGLDGDQLVETLKELSGVVPVTVDGNTFSISERYDDTGRQHFLTYWRSIMEGLGLTVNAIDYNDSDRPGHDLEAVLPGKSPDSIVVIVHYDSIGPFGQETANPGVDDDMTGMAILVQTARMLQPYAGRLDHTVRFVAADEEELGHLAGARAYARYIQGEAQTGGFHIVAAVDDEQTGWNCDAAGICSDPSPTFDVFTCDGTGQYDYGYLGDQLTDVVRAYSGLHVYRDCIGPNSDHYAMWEIGVPAIVFTEHDPFDNPHFDQNGGDTFDKIDTAYFTSIARPGIAFQAELVGIDSL